MALNKRHVKITLMRPTDTTAGNNIISFHEAENATSSFNIQNQYTSFEKKELSTELKIEFDCESVGPAMQGTVRVWNLSRETQDWTISEGISSMLQIDAGYDGGFSGEIVTATISNQYTTIEGVDRITTYEIVGETSLIHISQISISRSWSQNDPPLSLIQLIKDALDQTGVKYSGLPVAEFNDQLIYDAFTYQPTSLITFLDQQVPKITKTVVSYYAPSSRPAATDDPFNFASNLDLVEKKVSLRYEIRKGIIVFFWDNEPVNNTALVLSYSTGLKETPMPSKKSLEPNAIRVKHVLIPALTTRAVVKIENLSDLSKLTEGLYYIKDIRYKGSNWGGDHYADLELEEYVGSSLTTETRFTLNDYMGVA